MLEEFSTRSSESTMDIVNSDYIKTKNYINDIFVDITDDFDIENKRKNINHYSNDGLCNDNNMNYEQQYITLDTNNNSCNNSGNDNGINANCYLCIICFIFLLLITVVFYL